MESTTETNTNASWGKKLKGFAVTFSSFYKKAYISVFLGLKNNFSLTALQLFAIRTTTVLTITQGW